MQTTENKGLLIFFYICIAVFSVICLAPFILAVSGSLSTESRIAAEGYSFLPEALPLKPTNSCLARRHSRFCGRIPCR